MTQVLRRWLGQEVDLWRGTVLDESAMIDVGFLLEVNDDAVVLADVAGGPARTVINLDHVTVVKLVDRQDDEPELKVMPGGTVHPLRRG